MVTSFLHSLHHCHFPFPSLLNGHFRSTLYIMVTFLFLSLFNGHFLFTFYIMVTTLSPLYLMVISFPLFTTCSLSHPYLMDTSFPLYQYQSLFLITGHFPSRSLPNSLTVPLFIGQFTSVSILSVHGLFLCLQTNVLSSFYLMVTGISSLYSFPFPFFRTCHIRFLFLLNGHFPFVSLFNGHLLFYSLTRVYFRFLSLLNTDFISLNFLTSHFPLITNYSLTCPLIIS
ncbi:unnamed protein product [Acanthosepion pharaonis]|uniref:Uncharacterized protein n=1 Tax=Acanthosepion pharaonis TaxID=158019 RepID=A0A812DFY7_ACAPH|nr:unnamed protein product [Sepia pharaonis]